MKTTTKRKTWILAFSEKAGKWNDLSNLAKLIQSGKKHEMRWNFESKDSSIGDRVFLLSQVDGHRGIFGAGHIISNRFKDKHWLPNNENNGAESWYLNIELDWLIDYDKEKILTKDELTKKFPDDIWSWHHSGDLPKCDFYELEVLWGKHIGVEHNILNILRASQDIDPFTHDASYELIASLISCYAQKKSLDDLNFDDADCILRICNIFDPDEKRKYIEKCHLPSKDTAELLKQFDKCAEKYRSGKYTNESFGMFNSYVATFRAYYPNELYSTFPKDFVSLLIDIARAKDAEQAYAVLSEKPFDSWKGIKVATASAILHCLKPNWFPILNKNEGYKDIYQLIVPDMERKNTTANYIEWAEKLLHIKNEEYQFDNFRVIDIQQRLLGKGEEEKYMNTLKDGRQVFIVFQRGKRFNTEMQQGIIQAPDNQKVHHHKLAASVKAGDIIFHMSNKKVKAVSAVKSSPIVNNGIIKVETAYTEFSNAIDSTLFKEKFKRICTGAKYAPFDKNGEGNQGYFFSLDLRIAALFANAARKNNPELKCQILEDIIGDQGTMENPLSASTRINPLHKIGLNTILYGPPGTGKTYITKKYAVAICECGGDLSALENTPDNEIDDRFNKLFKDNRIVFTTFHQSYSYEDFIEGIKPKKVDDTNDFSYEPVDGLFKEFCDPNNNKNGEPRVFIIDEINRGNISKIFGELITNIEESKRGNISILPYSKDEFSVPSNIYLLGTMNTADRSIALLDIALRRRFDFVEMRPDTKVLEKEGINIVDGDIDVASMLEAMNERIKGLLNREHTIGHALFMDLKKENSLEMLARIFKYKIIPLLQEYFFEDYNKIALVLGDDAKTQQDLKFITSKSVVPSDVFEGENNEYVDDLNISYEINEEALTNPESYKKIYTKWKAKH